MEKAKALLLNAALRPRSTSSSAASTAGLRRSCAALHDVRPAKPRPQPSPPPAKVSLCSSFAPELRPPSLLTAAPPWPSSRVATPRAPPAASSASWSASSSASGSVPVVPYDLLLPHFTVLAGIVQVSLVVVAAGVSLGNIPAKSL